MTSLRDQVHARSNDYTSLEVRYRLATGAELVLEPYASFHTGPQYLNRSASILIGSYNSRDSLELSLISIESSTFNQTHPDLIEVIVVDDGSTDGTREMILARDFNLRITYVRQARGGLTAAHNTGAAFATGDVLIFADSDIIHPPLAIEEFMKRHQVLDKVTLLGFRFEIDPMEPLLNRDLIRSRLPGLLPDFNRDFRLSFPGRPSSMCRETDHLKRFGFGAALQMANGADYNLPAMVVGAIFSITRSDYAAIRASDERLSGWGCEDSLIGARTMALGNFIVPVYSAACGHISHARRDANESDQFARNIAEVERIMGEPFEPFPAFDLGERKRRAIEVVEIEPRPAHASVGKIGAEYPLSIRDRQSWGDYYYALGHFSRAQGCYEAAIAEQPGAYWPLLGLAKSKRELELEDACAEFDRCIAVDSGNPWGRLEGALAYARAGRYREARRLVEQSAPLDDASWMLRLRAQDHKLRGNRHAGYGLHRIAATDFDLALLIDPDQPWAHFDRAVSLHAIGSLDRGLESIQEADRLLHPGDGNRTWLHAEFGRIAADRSELNRAKLQLERAVSLYPGNQNAQEELARLTQTAEREHGLVVKPFPYERVERIAGWLSPQDADLLWSCVQSLSGRSPQGHMVELGSYCGKSTAVIASALQESRQDAVLVAIDPHEGYEFGGNIPTYDILIENLRRLQLEAYVKVVVARSIDVEWSEPIRFLFIDALHDYENVAADFRKFARHVMRDGIVAFHDYGAVCPDVRRFVNDVLLEDEFTFVSHRGDVLALVRKGAIDPS